MWPLDLPAREVLKLPGETIIAWAEFDWHWYIRAYPAVIGVVNDDDPLAILSYYLESGQSLGHSPNRMFDEQWHRWRYPQIAERVAAGHWRSAFDAYCRRGALDRSPHWLFDEPGYRDRYPDLTNEILQESGIVNRYDHYLRHGAGEGRAGHVLFDPEMYLSHFDPADVPAVRQSGVFQHYLNRIESGAQELRTSIYFDPAWYLWRYPEVAQQIEMKRWKCALHHYLCNDSPTAFDPLESFSESWYLQRDPGLQQAIAARNFRNGYMHFLRFGAKELRSPTGSIDLGWYASQPSVRSDLEQGLATDAFVHWLVTGAPGGLASRRSETPESSAGQAREVLHRTAAALLPITGRFGYPFEHTGELVLGVVMVVRDGFAATMATIASLRCNAPADVELVIVDLGSTDETRSIGRYIPGARVLRFESDIGFSRGADAGRQLCTAPVILFLSSDARIVAGSVERARARLLADPLIGAVGGMILLAHGVIAQAGGIVWNDGTAEDYQRGASPLLPEANFVRDVDFCAPSLLLVRASQLSRLHGFDHDCAAGYETVDLCLRIAQGGSRVIYDPSVMVVVDELSRYGDPGSYFVSKHAAVLAQRFSSGFAGGDALGAAASVPARRVQVFARHAGAKPQRVLFLEDTVPLRRIGSGFVRANDLVRVMASAGYAVTVFPVNGCEHDLAHVYGDMPEEVEVMHTLSLDDLGGFLEARAGYYDTVWIARTHNLAKVRPILARLQTEGSLKAEIVLDTEAVTPNREAIRAALVGESYDVRSAMQTILADAEICQQVLAVTQAEADTLRSYGFPSVSVIGHMIDPKPTVRPFAQRSGMLFVGAIHELNSPNFDSLIWFVNEVLPVIEAELKWETRLTVAGYIARGVDLSRFADHPRITLRGEVADLESLYSSHRVFVAPTRYAAGAPYKVLEAAARGLPVVATEVLRAQLGWQTEREMLACGANDAAGFAAGVLRLYRDEARWLAVREAALAKLLLENRRVDYAHAVKAVLTPQSNVGLVGKERPIPKRRRNS